MSTPTMSSDDWRVAHELARDLTRRRVSHNLVEDLVAYMGTHPNPLSAPYWLNLLTELGDVFASGAESIPARQQLRDVLHPAIQNNPDRPWRLTLSWVVRLMHFYRPAA